MGAFFIKDGYKENEVLTFNTDDTENYWIASRIESSKFYQYEIYRYAADLFKQGKMKSVVDFGSGPGTKMEIFFSGVAEKICIVDQPTLRGVVGSICPSAEFFPTNLEDGAAPGKFDMVICSDVIEHLANPDKLVKSIMDAMKDGGYAVISTPDRDIVRGRACNTSPNPQHVREWSRDEFANYLKSHGLKIVEHRNMATKKLNGFHHGVSALLGLLKITAFEKYSGNQMVVVKK